MIVTNSRFNNTALSRNPACEMPNKVFSRPFAPGFANARMARYSRQIITVCQNIYKHCHASHIRKNGIHLFASLMLWPFPVSIISKKVKLYTLTQSSAHLRKEAWFDVSIQTPPRIADLFVPWTRLVNNSRTCPIIKIKSIVYKWSG